MIKLVVFKNNTPYELDIDQKEGIEIVYEVKSLKIDTRSTFFSKSFNLYGTKNNNSFFEHNFTSNSNFENRKYDCRLYINGYDVIEGILTLKDITIDKYTNNIQYNVDIINKVYDFLQEWGEYKLIGNTDKTKDIDFSSIVKYANYQNNQMISSWTGNSQTHPFVYTIANYGYDWTQYNIQKPFTNLNLNAIRQDCSGLFPSLYLKTLFDLVFSKIGKYKSDFIESNDEFNKVIVLNPSKASSSLWKPVSNFDADFTILYTEQPAAQITNAGNEAIIELNSNNNPIGSPFITSGNTIVNPTSQTIKFAYDISGYFINNETVSSPTNTVTIYKQIYDSSTSTWGTKLPQVIRNDTKTWQEFALQPAPVTLDSGDMLRFIVEYTSSDPSTYNLLDKVSVNIQSEKRAIKASNLIPKDLTYGEFLTTVFKMFNLVLYYENKEIRIEPYREFYKNADVLDLTAKNNIIDRTSYQLSPLNEIIPNRIEAITEKGDDDLSVGFENTYKTNYGNAIVNIGGNGSNISIESKNITTQYDYIDNTIRFPYIYKIENNAKVPIEGGLRLLYWNGLTYQGINLNIDGTNTYLTPTTSLLYDITSTFGGNGINFSSPTLKWGTITDDYSDRASTLNNLTSNNGLLNNYYFDELRLYNKNEYKLTLKVNLKFDLGFKMNTLVYLNINGIPKYYRIEKITFSSDDSVLSQLELIPLSNIDGPIDIINSQGQSGSSSVEFNPKNTDFYGAENTTNGNYSAINGYGNTIGYGNFIKVAGIYNTINGANPSSGDSKSIIVEGDYNTIGDNTLNTIILGDYNEIPSNHNGAMWINNNNVVPYCKTVILTTGETHNLHTNPLKVLDKIDGYFTDVYDAYLTIYYLSGVTPTAYTNRTMGLIYSGDSEANHVALFDNRITTSTVQEKHRGTITTDFPLKSTNVILYTSGTLNTSGNAHFKLELYYRLHKIIT